MSFAKARPVTVAASPTRSDVADPKSAMPPTFLSTLDMEGFPQQRLAAGDGAVQPGQPTDRMLFLAEGRLRTPRGAGCVEAGGVVGLRSFFGAAAYDETLRADGGAVLVHVPRHAVQTALDAQDPLTWSLARILAQGGAE